MKPWTVRLVVATLVVATVFWARLFQSYRTRLPAREFVFTGASDAFVNCHGAAIVDGPVYFQLCYTAIGAGHGVLTRFDPARGVAEMLWRPPKPVHFIEGYAKDATGAALIAFDTSLDGELYRAHPEGRLESLGTFPQGIAGFAAAGDAIEVVDGRFGVRHALHTLRAGTWTKRELPAPAWDAEHWLSGEGAERRDGVWRTVHLRGPRRGSLPVDVEVLVTTEGVTEKVGTLRLDKPVIYAASDGTLAPSVRALRLVHGNIALQPGLSMVEAMPYTWENGRLVGPETHPALEHPSFDFVHGANGLETIVGAQHGPQANKVRGEWFTAEGSPALKLTRVRDGKTVAPVDSFWVSIGLKLLPAEGSGYVLTGGLGSGYVRLNADLERTDRLSFGERLARLFKQDRAKRNSDIYWKNAPLEKAAVAWALFAPLAIAALALVARKRPAWDSRVAIVSLAWLTVMVVAAFYAWPIVRLF